MAGLNERVRELVIAENISQIELARRMGCTRQNVNDKLNDGNMYISTLEKMLDAIGYEVVFKKK